MSAELRRRASYNEPMDAQTIGLICTSIASVVAACAAAYNTVRKTQIDTLNETIHALEKRVTDLEADLTSERTAHATTRAELVAAYEELQTLHRRGRLVPAKGAS